MSGRAELGAVGQLQAEMLHFDLIDGADGYRGDKESSKATAVATPPLTKDPAAPVTMDTYRPKRPTTLNLFPIVPRTQVVPEFTSTDAHTVSESRSTGENVVLVENLYVTFLT